MDTPPDETLKPQPSPPTDTATTLFRAVGVNDVDLGFMLSTTRADALGRLGHYQVVEVLGRGGFGIVFRAFDEVLQRVVAIKVLTPEMAVSSTARQRFLREARAAARVRHENVVQIHAIEEKPLPYLVMEFVPGETLQRRVKRAGPLDAGDVVAVGRQMAEGLAAAHAAGLIHRDIKPENILLESGPRLRVQITDFGLARTVDDASLTQNGVVVGTPLYMSPEQARGEQLDHRSDLFSLGSVLYVLCTGQLPFRADGAHAVLHKIIEERPPPLRDLNPKIPDWLVAVIVRLHAKKPADRFQTAQEVADLFGAKLAAAPFAARGSEVRRARRVRPPADTAQTTAKLPRGKDMGSAPLRLRRAVLIGVAAALIAGLGVILFWPRRGADKPNDPIVNVKNDPPVLPQNTSPKPPVMPAVPAVEQGPWVRLFNGKDLTDWKTATMPPKAKWEVEGAVLTVNGGVDLLYFTPRTYEDFHLRAEVKVKKGSGNLVFRMTSPRYDAGYGFGVSHTPGGRVAGTINLFRKAPPALLAFGKHTFHPDEWCKLAVHAQGPRLRTFVNGEPDNELVDATYSSGFVGLRLGAAENEVHFRNIDIQELRPAPAN